MDLFPPLAPYAEGRLAVDARHSLYWEQSGNPAGVAVVFLHGGPGGGAAPGGRRFFDPRFWRIVLFDQRGAGRSQPTADLTDNTTPDLVEDIERLRRHLGIERWVVFGGSWGSTLALAYGQTHPSRCLGFVLRGVFLFRRAETEWFLSGMRHIFPEAWRAFASFIPAAERSDLLAAYRLRLNDPDPLVHAPAAHAWYVYEESCSRLVPKPGATAACGDRGVLALARLEAHYMAHDGFLAEGQLLDNIAVLRDHPCVIVQGRYDVVCPMVTAFTLADAWPGAELVVVPDAGHAALEPGTRAALVAATQRLRQIVGRHAK